MKIGEFDIDDRVMLIAEVGNNHEGDVSLAEKMIDLAVEAGADAVKFQTLRADKIASKADQARFERLQSFELTHGDFERLARRTVERGAIFLSTPFDLESAAFLNDLCPAFKISSGDNNFDPLLETVAGFGKPIIFSAGAAEMPRVRYAKALIERIWSHDQIDPGLVVLHCVSAYPTPVEEANLAVITTLRDELRCRVGYSDHTMGIEAAVLSVALGARVIEKHFTLDKQHSDFRDHQLSADPVEMAELVRRVRQAESLLGAGRKDLQPSEIPVAAAVQRRIVAAQDLPQGTVIQWQHLNWIRHAEGMLPGSESRILGQKLLQPVREGNPICPELMASPEPRVLRKTG